LTQFVGRAAELEVLRMLVTGTRLLTLTGAGGSGKSRLALELAKDLTAFAADGIAWVELAPIEDERLLATAVLRALGFALEGAAATHEAVAASIGEQQVVLILDNCEHLVDGCAALADGLLRACPGLRIVATSREALGVAGERAWLVPPLGVPEQTGDLAALADSDAIRLFLDRAIDAAPQFTLNADNADAVAGICARLDGIPLAIELAAARIRHMAPEQIRERLGDAFALLTTGARTAIPRHRTLRATLDWSHDLLRDDARVVFRRLAVFRGGFTLDAAERVASGDGIAEGAVLDLVALLVDRSMVVVREQHGAARYQLLETIRQYAEQRLAESGEEMRIRHEFATHLIEVVALAEPAFITPHRHAAFRTLDAELDNIREVLQWTRVHEPAQHVRLVGLLWWYWFSTRHWVEAHRWLTGALELPEAQAPDRGRAGLLFAAGALASLRAQVAVAQPALEEAAALAAAIGDEQLEAYALNYLGMVYAQQNRVEAREFSGRAERWFRANGDLYGLRLALLLVGMADRAAGDTPEALRKMREAVAIARQFGQDRELAIALQMLATLLLDANDDSAAEAAVVESLHALRRDPSLLFIYRGLEYCAAASMERDPWNAARRIGAAESIRLHIAANRFQIDQERIERVISRLRDRLGVEEYERLHAEGTALAPADVLDRLIEPVAEVTGPVPAARPVATQYRPDAGTGTPHAASPADLRVRTLGPFEVAVRGTPVEAWSYAKPKELLVYLLTRPEGRTRGEIGAAIWPDATPAQLRNSFHVTVHHLRKALGQPSWVMIENERYRIASDITVDFDAARFELEARAALAVPPGGDDGDDCDGKSGAIAGWNAGLEGFDVVTALQSALSLYHDHFMNGETAGRWRDEEQDRLRRLYCDVGERLGCVLQQRGDFKDAAAAFEQVIAKEPLHEGAHRGLIECLAQLGHRARALRHFERYAARLEAELELEPEPELVELSERIRRHGTAAPGPLA
jgi:predicted ATPase/DNA-binding SARP family transcriptional activator